MFIGVKGDHLQTNNKKIVILMSGMTISAYNVNNELFYGHKKYLFIIFQVIIHIIYRIWLCPRKYQVNYTTNHISEKIKN